MHTYQPNSTLTKLITLEAMTNMTTNPRTDIILSMARTPTENYMQVIVLRQKDHEFRKRLYPSTIERIWFYETSPSSAITCICEIGQSIIRPSQASSIPINPTHIAHPQWQLQTKGLGNKGFNDYDADFEGYDYAYPIKSCRKILQPLSLSDLKAYGINGAPRGMIYVSERLMQDIKWDQQELIWLEEQ